MLLPLKVVFDVVLGDGVGLCPLWWVAGLGDGLCVAACGVLVRRWIGCGVMQWRLMVPGVLVSFGGCWPCGDPVAALCAGRGDRGVCVVVVVRWLLVLCCVILVSVLCNGCGRCRLVGCG